MTFHTSCYDNLAQGTLYASQLLCTSCAGIHIDKLMTSSLNTSAELLNAPNASIQSQRQSRSKQDGMR